MRDRSTPQGAVMVAYLLSILLLSLGCAPIPQPPSYKPPAVIPGEYVLKPERRHLGLVSPKKSYVKRIGDDVFYISRSGEYLHVKKQPLYKSATYIPYSASEDLCLTEFKGVKCDPNYYYLSTEEPRENELWGLKSGAGLNILDINPETPTVRVAVVDSGVNCAHEDISCDGQYDAINDRFTQTDDNGHGSHVAGTICAIGTNGKGITGVSRRCKIGAAKFLGASGGGSLFNAVRAIRWAIDNNYQIINNSWGGGGYSQILQDLVNEAHEKGILFIAAAGNSGTNNDQRPHYPSNYENTVSVASITNTGELSGFSNYGKQTVHIAAPGSNILSIDSRGGYRVLSGTSMATPHISGLLALLIAQDRSPEDALRTLLTTARRQHTDKLVHGVADGRAALGGSECREKACKKCMKECSDTFPCACRKWAKCKRECRSSNGCGIGCKGEAE